MKKLYIFIAICIIFIAIILIFRSGIFTISIDSANSKNDNWIVKEVKSGEIHNLSSVVPRWGEMSISQQFIGTKYNNNEYSSRITKISKEYIIKNIGNSTLTGYDTYTENTYSKEAELYSIKSISEECAIAVKFEGDVDYYVYVNSEYKPQTLGEFIEVLNLKENIQFGTIYYNYWDKKTEESVNVEFYNVNDEVIWQKLFSNPNLENIYSDNDIAKYTSERFSQRISISVDIPILGYKNISISLTDKGYLLTNILDTGKGFYIGEEKVKEFLDYIKENYDGYKIVYTYENSNNDVNEENNSGSGKIMMMENNSGSSTVVNTVTTNQNRTEAKEN